MNPAHLHLMLNHIPLVGIGFTILLMALAVAIKNRLLIKVSLVFVILVALWCIPAYLTGEPAEEMVENSPGISEYYLEEHEHFAEKAFIVVEVTGLIALIALLSIRFYPPALNKLVWLTLIALIVSGGMISWTANLGGKINHPEIRSDSDRSKVIRELD